MSDQHDPEPSRLWQVVVWFVAMAVVMVVGSIGGVLWMQRHYHYACWSWWC